MSDQQLKEVYVKFCNFSDRSGSNTMDGRTWKKIVVDAGLIGKGYTQADIDLTFARVKDKAAKKITYNEFLKAVTEVATKSGVSVDVIMNKVIATGGPKSTGTVANANKFHDDKSLYSGVHGKGGPSTNDNRINLSNLADRSASDARGVKKEYIGVTPPISTSKGTVAEERNSELLVEFLRAKNIFEPAEESRQREMVISKLNNLIQQWVQDVHRKPNVSEASIMRYRAEIITFGSYRLGVHSSGGDLDMLCVAPRECTRDSFFTVLRDMLLNHPDVTDQTCVPTARAPIMTFVFSGVDVDLLFASISLPIIPPSFDITDDSYLHTDEKSVMCMNGSRVTDMILKLAPNISTFRQLLRYMKQWAKERGLYSNKLGYLGGVSWAILSARVNQLYPNAPAYALQLEFFNLFFTWPWPEAVHLMKPREDNPLVQRAWQPNREDIFPIITPAYPCIDSTRNVSRTTKAVLLSEFGRAKQIIEEFKTAHATPTEEEVTSLYHRLLESPDFFLTHKHFIQMELSAAPEEVDMWTGMCESKILFLIRKLEETQSSDIVIRPWPYGVSANGKQYFFLSLTIPAETMVDISFAFEAFNKMIGDIPIKKDTMVMQLSFIRAKQLPEEVFSDARRPKGYAKKEKKTKRKEPTTGEQAEDAKITQEDPDPKRTKVE